MHDAVVFICIIGMIVVMVLIFKRGGTDNGNSWSDGGSGIDADYSSASDGGGDGGGGD